MLMHYIPEVQGVEQASGCIGRASFAPGTTAVLTVALLAARPLGAHWATATRCVACGEKRRLWAAVCQ